MWQLGNINTTPDGFGFFGLLYGRNAGFSNLSRFQLPEFDRLYEKARALPDGAAAARSSSAGCRSSSTRTRRGC